MDKAHRIVLFGGWSRFTEITLRQLLKKEIRVQSVFLDGFGPSSETLHPIPVEIHRSKPSSILNVCNRNKIPFHCFSDPDELLCSSKIPPEIDIILLSCYPKRFPVEAVNLARKACINIHPSLLPKYRGSNPIFWQIRNGETQTGVTLHKVSEQLDAGDILAHRQVPYAQGARLADIELKLIKSAVDCLHKLLAESYSKWERLEQKDEISTWYPPPCENDFVINTQIDAQKALNFIRAYAKVNRPIVVQDGARTYQVIDAVDMTQSLDISFRNQQNTTKILNFSNGRLLACIQRF